MTSFMIRFIIIVLFITTTAYIGFSDEGELLLGESEYIEPLNEKKMDKSIPKEKPKESKEKRKKKASNDIDKFIEMEIEAIFKKLKIKLTIEIKKEIKKEILMILKEQFKEYPNINKRKVRMKVTTTVKSRYKKKRKRKSTKFKRKKHKRVKPFLKIVNIRIGSDKPKKEKITQDSYLPISITIFNSYHYRKGKIEFFSKNIKTGKSYSIYKLEEIRFTRSWAQDQFVWKGNYLEDNEIKQLPPGMYAIICVLTIHDKMHRKKIITRVWGKGRKNYYITIE